MIPGNILVVDNEYKDVETVISAFEKNGLPVIYLASAPEEKKCPVNIRLIILDLDLDGCGSVTDEDILQAVLVLKRVESRTKFYSVALWSRYVRENEEWIEKIKQKYRDETGIESSANFLRPYGKELDQERLLKEIEKNIDDNPHIGTVFELERIVENAMDNAVTDIADAGGIAVILRSISKEIGKAGTPRQLSDLFNKILMRYSSTEGQVKVLEPMINKVLRKQLPDNGESILKWYAKFHNLQSYFKVDKDEPLWTGDIIKKKNLDDQFAVVLNPACDFAQNKVKIIQIAQAKGFKSISHYNLENSQVPPIIKWIGKKNGKYRKQSEVVEDIMKGRLPKNFYILYFLEPIPPYDSYFHILIDLTNIKSMEAKFDAQGGVKIPPGWKRVCRLDTPFVPDLLQRYASFASRVGTPDIPEEIRKEEINRIKSTA